MTEYVFHAIPLTPIHVGDGSQITPEDFLLRDTELVRFSRSAVLRDMLPALRSQVEDLLEKARGPEDLARVQDLIRSTVRPAHELGRIEVGAESMNELRQAVGNPERQGRVHTFVRNPHTDRPYLPGSSIKGAIRTALISELIRDPSGPGEVDASVAQAVAREGNAPKAKARVVEREALELRNSFVDRDPLRLLKVGDVELPLGSTRVDQALHCRRTGDGLESGDIQLHFERLLSRADGRERALTVRLELDERAMEHPKVKLRIGRRLNIDLIRRACRNFYVGRLRQEGAHFFSDDTNLAARYGLQGLLDGRSIGSGRLRMHSSLGAVWEQCILLRVGRFSHFESLSVDGLREGWNVKKKQPIKDMGSSRTLCRCRSQAAGAAHPTPFGWLLLRPAEVA
jgi:CRISPR-associated protein Csm5